MSVGLDLDLCRRPIDDVEEDLASRGGIGGREPVDAPAAQALGVRVLFVDRLARSRSPE